MDSGESTQESPLLTKKGESKTPRTRKANDLNQISPSVFSESLAEFFAENKNIVGFDNPGKSLYTTVRELVENALDSAESIGELPSIKVTIEEINNSALGTKVEESTAAKPMNGASIYRVTCKDNGEGMLHDAIPNMFGRVSFRKKYGVKQTRGRFGLGAKMVSIWSNMSTGLPIEIYSSMKNQNYTSFCSLDIDIHKNTPNIHLHEKRDDRENWHGAEIQVVIQGNWHYKQSVI